jgi:hypothetical protein
MENAMKFMRCAFFILMFIMGAALPAAESSSGTGGQSALPISGLLYRRPVPAGTSSGRPTLRGYTQKQLIAQLQTCSRTEENGGALAAPIFEEQKELLINELSGLQDQVVSNNIRLTRLSNDELRRYYTLVKQAHAPMLATLKNALEQELLKFSRYAPYASELEPIFAHVNVEDRIALLQEYDAAVALLQETFEQSFGQKQAQDFADNAYAAYLHVAKPIYQGKNIKVVDMSNKVHQQIGKTCGYHALFNAAQLYAWLTGKSPESTVMRALVDGPDIGLFKDILASSGSIATDEDFENIFEQDIVRLMQHDLFGMGLEHITIIPSVEDLYKTFFGKVAGEVGSVSAALNEHIPAIVEQLQQPGSTHAFILGTGATIETGGAGHWVAVVAHNRGGKLYLYAADSSGKTYGHTYFARPDMLQHLITVLKSNPDKLRERLQLLQAISAAQSS